MSDVTKAIRLSDKDWKTISSFLKKNPVFDFSSLARTSILAFVKNPRLEIHAVSGNEMQEDIKKFRGGKEISTNV